jgi:hypothetical protein
VGVQLESEPKKTILGESREVKDPVALSNLSGEVGDYAKEWSRLAEAADHQYGEATSTPGMALEVDRRVAGLPVALSRTLPESAELQPPSNRLIIESITK